jgi:hypothetical protein
MEVAEMESPLHAGDTATAGFRSPLWNCSW